MNKNINSKSRKHDTFVTNAKVIANSGKTRTLNNKINIYVFLGSHIFQKIKH